MSSFEDAARLGLVFAQSQDQDQDQAQARRVSHSLSLDLSSSAKDRIELQLLVEHFLRGLPDFERAKFRLTVEAEVSE